MLLENTDSPFAHTWQNPNLRWIQLSTYLTCALDCWVLEKRNTMNGVLDHCLFSFSSHSTGFFFLHRGIRSCQTGTSPSPCLPAHMSNCNCIICALLPPAAETEVPFSVESLHWSLECTLLHPSFFSLFLSTATIPLAWTCSSLSVLDNHRWSSDAVSLFAGNPCFPLLILQFQHHLNLLPLSLTFLVNTLFFVYSSYQSSPCHQI